MLPSTTVRAPLAAHHDAIRAAAVALVAVEPTWEGICEPDALLAIRALGLETFTGWERAGGFAGYGVRQMVSGMGVRWVFEPTGHAVQRLVTAATAPEPEPLTQPPDNRPLRERRFAGVR